MSSAGQLVGGVVGGAIGFFTGGPTGALYGAQIGMGVGGLIDPPKGPVLQGPKLSDLSQQTAGFGVPLPRYHGNMAGHGTVFWIEGGQLKARTRKESSGGKGGGGPEVKTTTYYATFALALADTTKTGPIVGIRRIWTTTGLLYDAGSDDIETIIASNEAARGFRVYRGTEDQMPDPRIEADLGVGNCPAWRGRAYIVFDDMELTSYGNSVAGVQVKVEVVGAGEYSNCPSRTQLPNMFPSNGALQLSIKYDNGTLLVGNGDVSPPRIERWSLDGEFIEVVRELPAQVAGFSFNLFSKNDPEAQLYRDGTVRRVMRNGELSSSGFRVGGGHHPDLVSIGDADYSISNIETWRLWKFRNGYLEASYDFEASFTNFAIGASETHVYAYVPTGPLPPRGEIWEFDEDLNVTGHWPIGGTFGSNSTIFPWPVEHRVLWGAFGPGASNITTLNDDGTWNYSCSQSGPWFSNAVNIKPAGIDHVWYSRSATHSSNRWIRKNLLPLDTKPLSQIVLEEALQSAVLTEDDLDVSQLTQPVRGYRIASQTSIRAALEPLQAAWPFDIAQRGYKIHFIPRGQASVMTIPAADLDARPAGAQRNALLPVAREMDTQIPRRVEVQFADIDREYDTNQTDDERTTIESAHKVTLELPIALTGAEAAGMPEVLLRMYWLERRDIGPFRLPPNYRALEAGDVITVEGGELGTLELRLTQVHLLSDGRLECMAKLNAAATYTPNAVAPDSTATPPALGVSGPSRYELLDIPLITDEFNRPGWFAAMCGYTAGWPGGLLYRTPDGGQTWTDLQGWVSPVTMGTCRTALPAGRTDIVDASSVLQVDLLAGDLSSITLESLYNGGNLLAIGAPGRWEIVAVATVEQQADGSYVLTDFLRGMFGTEWAASLHQAGDAVVALRDVDVAWIGMSSATIGQPLGYRGITSGKAIDSDTTREITYTGVNLKPLSPVYLNGSRHPSTRDWTLTWTRRTRVSPEWRDNVDVPIGEETEAYEIDIYDGPGYATVVRTLTASTPTVAYTSAEQIADFGSNQSRLYVKVYQMSATVGRGYPLTAGISGEALWTPANMLTPPAIWMDWNSSVTEVSGAASAWQNIGTLGGAFSQSTSSQRPSIQTSDLGALRYLRFDGSNDSLVSTSNAVLDLMRNVPSGWAFTVSLNRTDSGDSPAFWLARGTSTASRFFVGYNDGGAVAGGRRLDTDDFDSANAPPASGWLAHLYQIDYSARTAEIHESGVSVATQTGMWTSGGSTSNTRSTSPACIGRYASAAVHADMDIAALIVGAGSLPNEDDIDRLFGWAAWQAADAGDTTLLDALPVNHPYKDTPPLLT